MLQDDNQHLTVLGKLDLSNPMARAVHERMLLPSGNKMALKEMSVGFDYDRSETTRDSNGTLALHNVRLLEVSIVYEGAQETSISNVKNRGHRMWAGTTISKKAVDDLLARSAAVIEEFLDEIYESEVVKMNPTKDPELQRLNAEIDRLAGKAATPPTVNPGPVVTTAAARLQQFAVRALGVGLVDEAALLMRAARELLAGGDVQEVVDELTPVVQALRVAGSPVAGGDLERTLIELQGGTVTSDADPPVVADRDRFEPKNIPRRIYEPEIVGPAPDVDSRMRPIEGAAAVPTPDVLPPESVSVPTVTTQSDTYRVPAGAVVSHRRAS